MLDEILYPNVPTVNWQMLSSERIALTGLLARLRPRRALEVGLPRRKSVSDRAILRARLGPGVSIPKFHTAFVSLRTWTFASAIPPAYWRICLMNWTPQTSLLDFVFIDADHSAEGIRRDIETLIQRPRPPRESMFVLMHDSANPECRRGISSAGWAACPYVHHVELDFVPGQIVEYAAVWDGRIEVGAASLLRILAPRRAAEISQ